MIDYIPLAILTIIFFIFLINRQRKEHIKKERERARKESFRKQKKKEWEEYINESGPLSIEKNVKCDDGVTRPYDGYMFGIIKEKKEIPFKYSILDLGLSITKNYKTQNRNTEKWFSKEGVTLNAAQILTLQLDFDRLSSLKYHSIYNFIDWVESSTQFIFAEDWNLTNDFIILINNIFFFAGGSHSNPSPIKLFFGTIDGEEYKDGVIVQEENKAKENLVIELRSQEVSGSSIVRKINDKSKFRDKSDNRNNGGRLYSNTEIQIKITDKAKTLSDVELNKLCDRDYSKDTFNNTYSIFVKVPQNASIEERQMAIKDHNNKNRWTVKYEFNRNNYSYFITTMWYHRNDTFVKDWLQIRHS